MALATRRGHFRALTMPRCFKCDADASAGTVAIWDQKQSAWEKPKWLWVRNAVEEWQESSKSWERKPEALWSRQQVEAGAIYCESCWRD